MIDFRYHLVSLISVFLALAVGIVLGAGPLKEAIGDTLTGEVDHLRSRAADLRTELDETQTDLALTEQALAAMAPELLDGLMAQRRIAVVTMGDVDPALVEAVRERLGQAGAEVTASVRVTDGWTDPARRSYRQSLAGTLVEYLDPVPAQDAGTGAELAEALTQSLTTADPSDPDAFTEEARIVLGVLAEAELVTLEDDVTLPADAFVILVEPVTAAEAAAMATEEPADPSAAALSEEVVGATVQIAAAAQLRSLGVVVAGGDVIEGGLFERLRDGALTSRISTVESVDTLIGELSVPLALSARIGGQIGHYGSSSGATDLMPGRVVLPMVERIPAEVRDGAGMNGDGTDDAADDGATAGDATADGGEGADAG